jgi:hypothetical protein
MTRNDKFRARATGLMDRYKFEKSKDLAPVSNIARMDI